MLKITAPFQNAGEVDALIDAGADELYCGYLPREWEKEFTSLEFERKGSCSNFTDLKELAEAVRIAHSRKVPVYLALNGLYVASQYALLLKIIADLEKVDFDAYIIADIGLLLTLRRLKTGKKLHISTGGTVFNSESVDFYASLGASRIVLDRQTRISNMYELAAAHPGIDFEVFILSTYCVFIDGFCTFLHIYGLYPELPIEGGKAAVSGQQLEIVSSYGQRAAVDSCCLKYSALAYTAAEHHKAGPGIKPVFYKQLKDGLECGICALREISRTKVASVKIIGRQQTPAQRLKYVKLVRSALDILKENAGIAAKDFQFKVQESYRKLFNYPGPCRGNNCYHPEILVVPPRKFRRR